MISYYQKATPLQCCFSQVQQETLTLTYLVEQWWKRYRYHSADGPAHGSQSDLQTTCRELGTWQLLWGCAAELCSGSCRTAQQSPGMARA